MAKTTTTTTPRVRRSILELQHDYEQGINNDLEKVMTAWAYIKALPATDFNSFFVIGGYHGEPFAGEGATNSQWWGGYCNHANVLFPTWHRMYLVRLEKALQSAPGCEDVMQPYWDETDEYSRTYGIPHALTDQYFTFKSGIPQCLLDQDIPHNGNTIANPLASFTFTGGFTDEVSGDYDVYSKPEGYATVRYPLSGLVGNPTVQQQTTEHNAMFPDYNTNVAMLNANVLQWLNNQVYYVSDADYPGQTSPAGVAQGFADCLDAPNYTLFSNTQSANYYNSQNPSAPQITPLEQPHNDIHLSVGGFNLPAGYNSGGPGADFSQIPDANGDMGENDTAGLDPIFFFHHCNVDRMFWLWQQKNGFTDGFDIEDGYPGTTNAYNNGNGQGPADGQTDNETLTVDTDLKPFVKLDTPLSYYKTTDCFNIETQLNYTYSKGSLSQDAEQTLVTTAAQEKKSDKKIHISGVNRASIHGSFILAVFATIGRHKFLVGHHSILSRWTVGGCANCQTNLNMGGSLSLHRFSPEQIGKAKFHLEIIGRESQNKESFGKFRAHAATEYKPYKLEIR